MTSRAAIFGAAALVVAVGLMLLYVRLGWRAHELAVEVERLKDEQGRLLDEEDRLRMEIVRLTNVERIKRVAIDRLGLVEPVAPPVNVPAVAPLGPADSLANARATGLEAVGGGTSRGRSTAGDRSGGKDGR